MTTLKRTWNALKSKMRKGHVGGPILHAWWCLDDEAYVCVASDLKRTHMGWWLSIRDHDGCKHYTKMALDVQHGVSNTMGDVRQPSINIRLRPCLYWRQTRAVKEAARLIAALQPHDEAALDYSMVKL